MSTMGGLAFPTQPGSRTLNTEPTDDAQILTPVVLQKDFRGQLDATDYRPLPETYDAQKEEEDPKDSSAPEPVESSASETTGATTTSDSEKSEDNASVEKEASPNPETKEDEPIEKPQKQSSKKQTPSGKDELLA